MFAPSMLVLLVCIAHTFLTRHSACVDEVVMFRSTAFTSALSYFRFEGFEEPAKLINKIKNVFQLFN